MMSIHTFAYGEEIPSQCQLHKYCDSVLRYLHLDTFIFSGVLFSFLLIMKNRERKVFTSLVSNMRVFKIQTKPPCPESTRGGGRCSWRNNLFLVLYATTFWQERGHYGGHSRAIIPGSLASSFLSVLFIMEYFLVSELKAESYVIIYIKKQQQQPPPYNKDKNKAKKKRLFWDILIAIRNTGKRCYPYDAKMLWLIPPLTQLICKIY